MKVLVVGGTGLIGSHAASELLRRGHEVTVMARKDREHRDRRLSFMPGDYVTGNYDPKRLAGYDGLVFATGIDWRERPREDPLQFFRRVNATAPAQLFKAAREAGVRRSVFVTSYYHVVRPSLRDQPYLRSRFESEAAVLDACGGSLPVSILQPSWVMGPIRGMDAIGFGELLTRLAHGPWPIVCPPGGTNWISANALGIAIANALERGEDRRSYLVGDENWTWQAVFERFAKLSGTGKRVHVLPAGAVQATAWVRLLLRAMNNRRTGWDERNWSRLLMEDLFFDATPAQQALSYPAGDIARAIDDTYHSLSGRPVEHLKRAA